MKIRLRFKRAYIYDIMMLLITITYMVLRDQPLSALLFFISILLLQFKFPIIYFLEIDFNLIIKFKSNT